MCTPTTVRKTHAPPAGRAPLHSPGCSPTGLPLPGGSKGVSGGAGLRPWHLLVHGCSTDVTHTPAADATPSTTEGDCSEASQGKAAPGPEAPCPGGAFPSKGAQEAPLGRSLTSREASAKGQVLPTQRKTDKQGRAARETSILRSLPLRQRQKSSKRIRALTSPLHL